MVVGVFLLLCAATLAVGALLVAGEQGEPGRLCRLRLRSVSGS